jgi:hypothetical protein
MFLLTYKNRDLPAADPRADDVDVQCLLHAVLKQVFDFSNIWHDVEEFSEVE